MTNHSYWMSQAIQLACQGIYSTHPNPRVGCVIVQHNQLVGTGWHQKAGEPHAEVYALRQAAERARGATAYVTLEPCSHFGKTPPCVDALIRAGVSKVVIAMQDPNPKVAGKGIAKLQAAGVEVRCGILESQAMQLNKGFIKRMCHGLPYVKIKLAMSLDGRTAMADGKSQWITGPDARREVQRMRAQSSAVITGADTVILDDARLTVRPDELGLAEPMLSLASAYQPLRVLIDSQQRVPLTAAFYQSPYTLTISSQSFPDGLSGEHHWMVLGLKNGHIDLLSVLQKLASEYEVNELLVEAGAMLAGAFTRARLVDEYAIFMAGKLLGSNARPLLQLPLDTMQQALSMRIADIRAVGDDWLFTVFPTDL